MRLAGVTGIIAIMVLALIGCGSDRTAAKAGGAQTHKYNVVDLKELVKQPGMFTNVPITFRCLMGRTGDVFVAMNTHFVNTDTINFGVWSEDARLWIDDEKREQYHPLLYIKKDSKSYPLFRDIKPYEVVDVFGIVRDTYAQQPWIEVMALRRVMDEKTKVYFKHFTDDSLFYIRKAIEYEKEGELDFAIEDYSEALKLDLPTAAHVEVLYARAKQEVQKEKFDTAKATLEECVAVNYKGGHYEAPALLGEVYRQLGDFDKAVENSEKALQIKPDYYPALRTFGISLAKRINNPDYNEAERKCKRALKFDPTDPTTNWYLGQVYCLQTRFNEAIDYYRKAIDYYPQNHYYHKDLAYAHYLRSNVAGTRPEDALSDKRIALHEYEIVRTIQGRTATKDADIAYYTGVVKEEMGALLNAAGQAEEATKSLDEATQSFEECVKIDPSYKIGWDALAKRYVAYQRFDDAVGVYDNLLKLEPANTELMLKKAALLYNDIKDKARAVATLLEALKINPDKADLNHMTGRYLLELGWDLAKQEDKGAEDKYREAAGYLAKANQLADGGDIRILRDLVFCHFELKNWKDAAAAYAQAALLLPKDTLLAKAEMIDLYNKTGAAYMNLGQSGDGLALFNKSLELDNAQTAVQVLLAQSHLKNKRYDEALKCAEKAVALGSTWETVDLYAWALAMNGRNDEAKSYLEKIISTNKASINFHLGMVSFRLKEFARAKELFSNKEILDHPEFGKEAKDTLKAINAQRR
ncbi:MAG: tetratricopeptide repeat protein [Planctomycetota bacterium]